MNPSIDPDFTKKIIHIENNQDSQKFFEKNTKHFTKQCRTLLRAYLRGERLTTLSAIVNYGIGDLRRRHKDLIDDYKVPCTSRWIKGKRCKEYFIDLDSLKNIKSCQV